MVEFLKALFCCFGPAILYQIAKTIRERMERMNNDSANNTRESDNYENSRQL